MATLTRSSRRADALHPRSSSNVSNARLIATSTRGGAVHPQTILKSPPMMPRAHKRPLEVSDHEYEAIRKKTRITVEIISRSTIPIPKPPTAAAVNLVAPSPQLQHQKPTGAAPKSAPHTAAPTVKTEEATATTASHEHGPSDAPSGLTKHQKKVINGIRHELDRLQPNADDTRREGRKLRSQEGTRFKSELSAYFPEYDEIIGNEPKEHHIVNLETPIIIVDRNSNNARPQTRVPLPPTVAGLRTIQDSQQRHNEKQSVRRYSDELFENLWDSQCVDFSFLESQYKGKVIEDPLPDSYFEPSHKKAERLEKSIRNTERGRAQHEKDQIIRLLEGLEGHDWLRVMGVSGITESKKKSFEPARRHFIKGCHAILEKFRLWNLEEKRRKQERDRAASQPPTDEEEESGNREEEAEEEEAEEEEEEEEEEEGGGGAEEEEEEEEEEREIPDSQVESEAEDSVVVSTGDEQSLNDAEKATSDGEPPDLSDVDASIEKQLQEEALARSQIADSAKAVPARTTRSSKPATTAAATRPKRTSPPAEETEPQEAFRSFFRKKHEREAALSRTRKAGRKCRDVNTLNARERTRRRDNRLRRRS